jgi:hypothetical protein
MTAGSYYSEADGQATPAAAAAAAAGAGSSNPGIGQIPASSRPHISPAAAAAASGSGGSSSSNAFARMRQATAAGSAVRGGDPGLRLHLVWTTAAEVQHSREGWAAGNSIPGSHKNVMRPFLQQHYCRCV